VLLVFLVVFLELCTYLFRFAVIPYKLLVYIFVKSHELY